MAESKNEKCKGHDQCKRRPFSGDLCEFHLPIDHDHVQSCDKYDALLIKEIEEAVENKNGMYVLNWHGFNFPKDHVLFDYVKYEAVRGRLAKSWINIQESNIQNILIQTFNIHTLILSHAIIHADTSIGVIGIDRFSMGNANFRGKFHCASKTHDFDARGATFNDEFSFAATVYDRAVLTNCRFHKSCFFYGSAGLLFGNEEDNKFNIVGFDNTIFGKPIQTYFRDADLRKASFKSVSLVGVQFSNTNFYQKELNRNGIYNEVKELQRGHTAAHNNLKPDKNSIKRYRHLIHEYRQLRMAMENNKDYIKAQDFYVGEMESRQRREWNIILALYRGSSFYGADYVKAFRVLIYLFCIHFMLTIILSTHWQVQKLFYGPDIVAAWGRLGDIVIHTLSTGTLQRSGLLDSLSFPQKITDVFFRLFIPIQAAMFVLALRNKTKR